MRRESVLLKYSAQEFIHHAGEVFEHILFLNSGIARSYFINKEGREFTWSLHYNEAESRIQNYFIVDYASFICNESSHLYFEALTDIEVVVLKRTLINELYSQSHEWANIGRKISEAAYYHTHHRSLSLLTCTAKERYLQLLEDSPSVFSIVPQFYIASYLEITAQSLSRLKKELSITICE